MVDQGGKLAGGWDSPRPLLSASPQGHACLAVNPGSELSSKPALYPPGKELPLWNQAPGSPLTAVTPLFPCWGKASMEPAGPGRVGCVLSMLAE